MENSWENWLSPWGLLMNGDSGTDATVSGVSFEEMIGFNGNCCYSSNALDMEAKPKREELTSCCSGKRGIEKHDELEKRGAKKARTSSEALYHIMSERKRRQDIAEKFIALSATIPGLKKIDKASVLQEAINYVQQLQKRISVLEEGTNEKRTKSLIIIKSHETDSNDNYVVDEVLPEIEARGLEKEILIRIHCEKRKGIMLKLLSLLNDVHLSIASSSVLPFGNSILNIIIIAQMSDKYNLTVSDLVKTLKEDLFKL